MPKYYSPVERIVIARERALSRKAQKKKVVKKSPSGYTSNEGLYLIKLGEYVRLGYSTNWQSRVGSHRSSSPQLSVVIVLLGGALEDENCLHHYLRARNYHHRDSFYHWKHGTVLEAIYEFLGASSKEVKFLAETVFEIHYETFCKLRKTPAGMLKFKDNAFIVIHTNNETGGFECTC
jgi:hypothetical protein